MFVSINGFWRLSLPWDFGRVCSIKWRSMKGLSELGPYSEANTWINCTVLPRNSPVLRSENWKPMNSNLTDWEKIKDKRSHRGTIALVNIEKCISFQLLWRLLAWDALSNKIEMLVEAGIGKMPVILKLGTCSILSELDQIWSELNPVLLIGIYSLHPLHPSNS